MCYFLPEKNVLCVLILGFCHVPVYGCSPGQQAVLCRIPVGGRGGRGSQCSTAAEETRSGYQAEGLSFVSHNCHRFLFLSLFDRYTHLPSFKALPGWNSKFYDSLIQLTTFWHQKTWHWRYQKNLTTFHQFGTSVESCLCWWLTRIRFNQLAGSVCLSLLPVAGIPQIIR